MKRILSQLLVVGLVTGLINDSANAARFMSLLGSAPTDVLATSRPFCDQALAPLVRSMPARARGFIRRQKDTLTFSALFSAAQLASIGNHNLLMVGIIIFVSVSAFLVARPRIVGEFVLYILAYLYDRYLAFKKRLRPQNKPVSPPYVTWPSQYEHKKFALPKLDDVLYPNELHTFIKNYVATTMGVVSLRITSSRFDFPETQYRKSYTSKEEEDVNNYLRAVGSAGHSSHFKVENFVQEGSPGKYASRLILHLAVETDEPALPVSAPAAQKNRSHGSNRISA